MGTVGILHSSILNDFYAWSLESGGDVLWSMLSAALRAVRYAEEAAMLRKLSSTGRRVCCCWWCCVQTDPREASTHVLSCLIRLLLCFVPRVFGWGRSSERK